MKIQSYKINCVNLPLAQPIRTALHDMRSVGCCLLRLYTDDGIIGEGFLFTLNGARLKAFSHMLDGLAQMAVGRNPFFVTKLWEDIWQEINPSGHKGVTISALSALDTACWDIIGKAANLPLHGRECNTCTRLCTVLRVYLGNRPRIRIRIRIFERYATGERYLDIQYRGFTSVASSG